MANMSYNHERLGMGMGGRDGRRESGQNNNGGLMLQSQSLKQEYGQLLDRQILLDQIEDTYNVFKNYLQQIINGNEQNASKGNILMTASLNLLMTQTGLTIDDNDNDALMMAQEFVDRKNMEMKHLFYDALNHNRDVHETFLNTSGYINAVMNKEDVPTIDAPVLKSVNGASANKFVSGLVGNVNHSQPNRREEIEKNPQKIENEQMELLQSFKRKNSVSRNTRFDVNFLTHHVKKEMGPYRGGSGDKNKRRHASQTDDDFEMFNSAPELEGNELMVDWISSQKPTNSKPIRVYFLKYDKFNDLVTIFDPNSKKEHHVKSREILYFHTLPQKYIS